MNLNFKPVLSVLFSVIVIGFTSCSKDDSDDTAAPNPTPPAVTASMTATVDGVAWASISSRAAGSIISNTSNLTGVATDSTVITMTVTQNVVLNGTYDLGPSGGNAGVFSPSTSGSAPAWSSNAHPTSNGQLKITAMDTVNKRFSGTFNFKAWRATDNTFRQISNGVFTNVPYSTSITSTGSNTFTVKIDNVPFTPAVIAGSVAFGDLTLTASDSQGSKSVGISMPETVTPGTYAMGTIGDDYFGQYNPNGSTFTVSTSGSLTITSHNTTTNVITGTFNFISEAFPTGPPTYSLTNGSFSITY